MALNAVNFDFSIFIDWFSELWSVLNVQVISAYGLNLSIADIIVGGFVTAFIISLFWKGARA